MTKSLFSKLGKPGGIGLSGHKSSPCDLGQVVQHGGGESAGAHLQDVALRRLGGRPQQPGVRSELAMVRVERGVDSLRLLGPPELLHFGKNLSRAIKVASHCGCPGIALALPVQKSSPINMRNDSGLL